DGGHFTIAIPSPWLATSSQPDSLSSGREYKAVGEPLWLEIQVRDGQRLRYQTPEVVAQNAVAVWRDKKTLVAHGPRLSASGIGYQVTAISEEGSRVDSISYFFAGPDIVSVYVWGEADVFRLREDSIDALFANLIAEVAPIAALPDGAYITSFATIADLAYAVYSNPAHTMYVQGDAPLFDLGSIQGYYARAADTVNGAIGFPVLRHPDVYIVREAEMSRYAMEHGLSRPGWVAGLRSADGIFVGPQSFAAPTIASVLTHELAHDVIDTVDPLHRIPIWLNEGLAEHAGIRAGRATDDGGFDDPAAHHLSTLRVALDEGTLFSFSGLRDWEWTLSSTEQEVSMGYAQSWAFIGYLAMTHGDASIAELVWRAAMGDGVDASIEAATGHQAEEVYAGFIAWLPGILSIPSGN
ncbi:MAG: peptidase MA family metallohydrolase, partial [Chloroflexi bacterium]|nr:peptidase MA family metallohydrolase [Chloroflexota bacterium]